jgi:hypothetical protein
MYQLGSYVFPSLQLNNLRHLKLSQSTDDWNSTDKEKYRTDQEISTGNISACPTVNLKWLYLKIEKFPDQCILEFYFCVAANICVKWVRCHYGMARPQVADGGDGLQIWRVAANILNKQSRTANRGRSSSFGIGREANKPLP